MKENEDKRVRKGATSKQKDKVIRVALKNGDFTKVKVSFMGGAFTPEEFTSVFMAVLETYTAGLLVKNSNAEVFEHFNRVFGIFLNKLVPEKEHYELSDAHKAGKEVVDKIFSKEEDPVVNEENRLAAYILARETLVNSGMTEESADLLLNRQMGILKTPNWEVNYEETQK